MILIVEDNELNMKLFNDILEYQKYQTDKAFDGIAAYNKILKNKYDLIILDIQLPKMDGFSLIEKLKKQKINVPPVVIVSACAMDNDKKRASELGINNYITKPIDINNFVKIIAKEIKK